MKQTKKIACTLAALMAVSSLSALPVHAADYQPGDVDMDGILTPLDGYLALREYAETNINNPSILTDEQKVLADLDGDGVISMEDAAQIFIAATSIYDLNLDGKETMEDLEMAADAYFYLCEKNPGKTDFTLEDYDANCGLTELQFKIATHWFWDYECLNPAGIQYALNKTQSIPVGDMDMDGEVTLDDATAVLTEYCELAVHNNSTLTNIQAILADTDCDGNISLEDAKTALTTYFTNVTTPKV